MSQTMDTAFKRIGTEYGKSSFAPDPWAPAQTFKASRAYDKLIGLTILALLAGVAGWAVVPEGIAFLALIVAFGVVLVSWFKMGWAKVLAPVYAVCEGVGLGAISGIYASQFSGIIPLAIVFTAGVFIGTLGVYRTGLVRVTPRMVSMVTIGAMGLIAVSMLSLFISLPIFNAASPLWAIFGVLMLVIAVTSLLVDFDHVQRAEAMRLPAEAEWASAFAMMTALVLVYLSILRILLVFAGGGGRRR
jgi:uncharacterized YccA/Bax inhibitor family protein